MEGPPAGLAKPDFNHIFTMFSMQAIIAAGAAPNPATGEVKKDLRAAQYFIEVLGVLKDKSAGNLSVDELKHMEATLHQVRMAFMQASQSENS